MKTKLFSLFGSLFFAATIYAQSQEAIANDDDSREVSSQQSTSSPLMMFRRDLEKGKYSNNNRNDRDSSSDEDAVASRIAQQRRKTEEAPLLNNANDRPDNYQSIRQQEAKPMQPTTAEEIFARRYMKLDSHEFEVVAGPKSWWLLGSPEYMAIMSLMKQYQTTQDVEEKKGVLDSLQQLVKAYREKEEDMREVAVKKHRMTEKEIEEVKRAHRRIDACNLLERGLLVEECHLEDREMAYLDPEQRLLPRKGIRFRPEQILEFKSNFASGMMSSVARLRHIDYGEKDFIFKEENPLIKLTAVQAKQLGFSLEQSEQGVTKKMANLSGRSLATYKIDGLLRSALVPQIRFASLGSDGRAKIGHVQDMVDGVELYKEETIPVSQQEYEDRLAAIGEEINPEICQRYLADAALGGDYPENEWQLVFPDSLVQTSREKPLQENGQPINRARALELAEQGALSFQKKELVSVDETIDFEDPLLQKEMANAHLLHLITGELDPNPGNFIYVFDSEEGWHVRIIDSDLSFSKRFVFSDSSQLHGTRGELKAMMDVSLQQITMTLQAGLVLKKMPLLVDETMGEEILALEAAEVETALQGTGLTPEEIAAVKNRLAAVQKYLQAVKNENGFVRDQMEEEMLPSSSISSSSSSSSSSSNHQPLVWGRKTYTLAKANPDSSYLGRTLEDQAIARERFQQLLLQKIQKLELKASRSSKEDEALEKMKQQLQRLQHPQEPERVTQRRSSVTGLLAVRRPSEVRSVASILSKKSNKSKSTITSWVQAANNVIYRHRHSSIELGRGSSLMGNNNNNIFRSQLSEQAKQLARLSNEAHLAALSNNKVANDTLAQAREKALAHGTPLEELVTSWQETVNQIAAAEQAWSKAVRAYEVEKENTDSDFKNYRQQKLDEAIEKQNASKVNLLWARVHQVENAAVKALEKSPSLTTAWTNADKKNSCLEIGDGSSRVQQSWGDLFLHCVVSLKNLKSTAIWKNNLEYAKNVQRCTSFPLFWIGLIGEHIEHIESALSLERLQDELDKLASSRLIHGYVSSNEQWGYTTRNYVVIKPSQQKLEDLCNRWKKIQSIVQNYEKIWSQGIDALSKTSWIDKLSPTNAQLLFTQRPSRLKQAQGFSNLNEVDYNMLSTISSQSMEGDNDVKRLLKVETLCRDLLEDYKRWNHVRKWHPNFPTVSFSDESYKRPRYRVYGTGMMKDGEMVEPEKREYYNHQTVKPVRVFLDNINKFPACLKFKDDLKEMVDAGQSALVEQRWNTLLSAISKLRIKVRLSLERALEEKAKITTTEK